MISGAKDLSHLIKVTVDKKEVNIHGVGALVVLNISSYRYLFKHSLSLALSLSLSLSLCLISNCVL